MDTKIIDESKAQEAVDKLLGLQDYVVWASETVYYRKVIKAHNEDEAYEVARDESYAYEDIEDSDYFEITSVEPFIKSDGE